VANSLRFPQKFALVCRLWELEPSSKEIARALDVDQASLTRWANFQTLTTPRPERELIDRFAGYLDESGQLAGRGYNAAEFAQCCRTYDDKQFLQFLSARSLPASVRELSQAKFSLLCRTLLGRSNKARYFMYRLGTFEREDLTALPDPAKGIALLQKSARVLRRVPASIEKLLGESFLLYREAYREKEESIGSVFHVDSHFTIWGQDSNDSTSELFLITIKPEEILYGDFEGLFQCVLLMLGDLNQITACKALMRRVSDDLPDEEEIDLKLFARESQRTIVLAADPKDADKYKIDHSFAQEAIEPETGISYEKYADFLGTRGEREAIVLT
jgi:hypothetical protein